MAITDRTYYRYMEADENPLSDTPESADLEWAVVHGLVAANVQTMQALEDFYYHRYYEGAADLEMVRETLSEAIATHAAIQEDLESVRELLDDIDR
jgi:hypothetical protein